MQASEVGVTLLPARCAAGFKPRRGVQEPGVLPKHRFTDSTSSVQFMVHSFTVSTSGKNPNPEWTRPGPGLQEASVDPTQELWGRGLQSQKLT